MMRGVSRHIGLLLIIYAGAWTASYIFFVGLDFRYFFQYLRFAWTGPGELAAFVQALALILTAICFTGVLLWKRFAGANKR